MVPIRSTVSGPLIQASVRAAADRQDGWREQRVGMMCAHGEAGSLVAGGTRGKKRSFWLSVGKIDRREGFSFLLLHNSK